MIKTSCIAFLKGIYVTNTDSNSLLGISRRHIIHSAIEYFVANIERHPANDNNLAASYKKQKKTNNGKITNEEKILNSIQSI